MAANVAKKFTSLFVSLFTMPLGFRYPRAPLGVPVHFFHSKAETHDLGTQRWGCRWLHNDFWGH